MTPEDEIKKIVRDVIAQDRPEMARRKRIADDKARFDAYVAAPPSPRPQSAVDATNAPVHFEETVLPMQTFSLDADAPGSNAAGNGAPPLEFATMEIAVCDDDDMDQVVTIYIQPS